MPPLHSQLRRLTDWRGWLLGLYLAAFPQAIGRLIDWLGTNGAEASGLPVAKGLGLTWKQAAASFGLSIAFNALLYLKSKPIPETIERPVTPPPFANLPRP